MRVYSVYYDSYDVRFVLLWYFMPWEQCDGHDGGGFSLNFCPFEVFLVWLLGTLRSGYLVGWLFLFAFVF